MRTDQGHKLDELMTLLGELLEDPTATAVVFSQWLGTHELIARRLAQRAWGHVLFSGGVPGDKRGALVERFHDDPDCRLFLSTDAAGVGLNLQHAAAVVVNMDVPWNPAELEQRIGRAHRTRAQDELPAPAETGAGAEVATPRADTADPWAAIQEAGAALLQGLAASRGAAGARVARFRSRATRSPVRPAFACRCPIPPCCSGWPRHSSPG